MPLGAVGTATAQVSVPEVNAPAQSGELLVGLLDSETGGREQPAVKEPIRGGEGGGGEGLGGGGL